MAKTIDEQLTDLEEEIRRLKIEFDIYFNNPGKRPPFDSKFRVEALIKRIAEDRGLRFGTRFRYNTVVARYTSFRELWRRQLQDREEGRDPRSLFEAHVNERNEAARKYAEEHQHEYELDLDTAFDAIHEEKSSVRFKPTRVTFNDPKSEEENVRQLYQSVIAAKLQCGESIDNTSYDQFHKMIIYNANKMKAQRNCDEISFSVDVEDGKVKFKADGNR